MSGCLLDVNVLIALTWPTHVHHAAARRWFDRESRGGWATCPLTQLGHRQMTDAYLLALARHHGGKPATLDRGVPGLLAERGERTRWVELIEMGS